MKEAHLVLRDTGGMYVFSSWNNLEDVLAAIDDAGFKAPDHLAWRYYLGAATRKKCITSH